MGKNIFVHKTILCLPYQPKQVLFMWNTNLYVGRIMFCYDAPIFVLCLSIYKKMISILVWLAKVLIAKHCIYFSISHIFCTKIPPKNQV